MMHRHLQAGARARRCHTACMLLLLAAVLGMLAHSMMDRGSNVTELPRIQWDAIPSNTEFASPARLPRDAWRASPNAPRS
jgi:thiosulfate reductase cytochrome b subunit